MKMSGPEIHDTSTGDKFYLRESMQRVHLTYDRAQRILDQIGLNRNYQEELAISSFEQLHNLTVASWTSM